MLWKSLLSQTSKIILQYNVYRNRDSRRNDFRVTTNLCEGLKYVVSMYMYFSTRVRLVALIGVVTVVILLASLPLVFVDKMCSSVNFSTVRCSCLHILIFLVLDK